MAPAPWITQDVHDKVRRKGSWIQMARATLILNNPGIRAKAMAWVSNAPQGTRVEFKEQKRSLPQNDLMWAMLTDVAQQVPWYGVKMTPDDWKLVFLDGLHREMRIVPNLDGTGFVNLGRSSSDLSKGEMADMIELIGMFGAKHSVVFHGPGDPLSLLAEGADCVSLEATR